MIWHSKKIFLSFFFISFGFILLCMSVDAYAINIAPNTIIRTPTFFKNTEIDLTNGNFIVKNNALLSIENCTIKGALSAENPKLIKVEDGSLTLSNNTITISAPTIVPHPDVQSLTYVVWLYNARLQMNNNKITMTAPFTAGLLITDIRTWTDNLKISNNRIEGFHGALYLLNTVNSTIENNILIRNSYGNIVVIGDRITISGNHVLFSGNDLIGNGDAIDVIDSDNIDIINNVITTPGCYGIWIMSSANVAINLNTITGGVTYGINMTNLESSQFLHAEKVLRALGKKEMRHQLSNHITIMNNALHQNKYGIIAEGVDQLIIANNFFSQRFSSNSERQFWTDNNNLLKNVTGLIWQNNLYKEAFSQQNIGDNSKTEFRPYPASGGVIIR